MSDPLPAGALPFAFRGDELLVRPGARGASLPDADELAGRVAGPVHPLGAIEGRPCYALALRDDAGLPAGTVLQGLRALYGALPETHFQVAVGAVQIVAWDRTHRFCSVCGTPTVEARTSDRAKRCPNCGQLFFPRLAPAIIVRVRRGDELLLARSARFPAGMYSVLAGFVEPGETLEQAVVREVDEEVGLRVGNLRYFGSQPWPFPHSLMIGFTADYLAGELTPDPAEIEEAGWFGADRLPALPSRISIARRLIDAFLADLGAVVDDGGGPTPLSGRRGG